MAGSTTLTLYPNIVKNPTPLMFIKVLPGITFEFRFKLTSSKVEGKMNKKFL
jgi:hypothetical protein